MQPERETTTASNVEILTRIAQSYLGWPHGSRKLPVRIVHLVQKALNETIETKAKIEKAAGDMKHVEGIHKEKKVFLFALSTCIWCKKTKQLLNEMEIEYDYEDVDLLPDDERRNAESVMNQWGGVNFPLIIIDGQTAVYYFDDIRKKLST